MSKRVRNTRARAKARRRQQSQDPAPPGTPGTPHPDPRAQLIQYHQSQRQQFEAYKQVLIDAIEATNSLADLLPEGTPEAEVAALRAEAALLEAELKPVQESLLDTLRALAEVISEVLYPAEAPSE